MTNLTLLKERLKSDSTFRSLFIGAGNAAEAIRISEGFGVHLTAEDISTYRNELRAMVADQSYQLDIPKSRISYRPSSSYWVYDASGGCSDHGGSDYGGSDYGGSDHGGACSDF